MKAGAENSFPTARGVTTGRDRPSGHEAQAPELRRPTLQRWDEKRGLALRFLVRELRGRMEQPGIPGEAWNFRSAVLLDPGCGRHDVRDAALQFHEGRWPAHAPLQEFPRPVR